MWHLSPICDSLGSILKCRVIQSNAEECRAVQCNKKFTWKQKLDGKVCKQTFEQVLLDLFYYHVHLLLIIRTLAFCQSLYISPKCYLGKIVKAVNVN